MFQQVRFPLDALVEFEHKAEEFMQRSYINSDCLRWMMLGSLLAFATFFGTVGSQASWAQTAASGGLTVQSIAVGGAVAQPEIEVKTSGPVTPATQAVTGPDRIVIDFPGALPARTLRALGVHHGSLRGIRTGLFQSQPPITRVVLDVDGPTDYQVTPVGNSIVIRLGKPAVSAPSVAARAMPSVRPAVVVGNGGGVLVPVATDAATGAAMTNAPAQVAVVPTAPVTPPRPKLDVAVRGNLLSIHAEGATLAEVLYEVHRKTGADIAIPAGAEQERVVVRLGPAPGKEVISTLLNGSRFNYILVGSDRDPGGFNNLLLSLKSGNGSSGMFAQTGPPPGGQFGGQPPAIATPPDPGMEQAGVDPSLALAEPELDTVPDEAPEPAASGAPGQPQPQQVPVQPIGDGVRQ